MDDLLQTILTDYGFLLYPLILAWTFVEGETVVIVTGAIASEGKYNISVEMLALFAFCGSFLGDQLYYYIGRRYGTPLLARWPTLGKKIDWAFHLVKTHPTLFILSFRFIYGIRNVAPFVIGISGVPRLRYAALNFIAAMVWAHTFAWGGYWLGRALEEWLGENKWYMLVGFVLLAGLVGAYGYFGQKKRMREIEAKEAEAGICETRPDV
ncbi:DedA family protein [Magnetospirillum sp. UT-4]|uniref:DedA family protein n=1 Tax=Magnetospirillum sp. UT-4 TaxID=2681467 RepID=UPI00137E7A93|nr:DedA family protein [Magnetospirillum sp. UT-4]CAA7627172.1 DedA family protein [Magnetospirillum sp. UT-4]